MSAYNVKDLYLLEFEPISLSHKICFLLIKSFESTCIMIYYFTVNLKCLTVKFELNFFNSNLGFEAVLRTAGRARPKY